MLLADRRREWFGFGRVFERAGKTFAATLPAGLLAMLLFVVLPQMLSYWLGDKGPPETRFTQIFRNNLNIGSSGLGLLTLVAGTLGQAGIVAVALAHFHGRPVGPGEGLVSGLRFALPAIGIGILTYLGVVLGLILLIVPGLMLMTIWVVALPAQLDERRGVIPSIEESGELTKGVRWQVFGLLLITAVASIALGTISRMIGGLLPDSLRAIVDGGVTPLIAGIAALYTGYGTASLYHELKWGDRDPNEEAAAEVFA